MYVIFWYIKIVFITVIEGQESKSEYLESGIVIRSLDIKLIKKMACEKKRSRFRLTYMSPSELFES
jgi:hypothetical protein